MIEFKKENEYDSEIEPAVKALAALCYSRGIPMFFSAAVANTSNGGTTFKTEYVSPAKVNVTLHDDQLSRHVNVKNGFETVMPVELDEIEID
ncbi:MAG: hypothetical protein LBI03_07520 [Clostridiales bacterium]|nr:hypothetical protein [Clostridiales bacterium]